MSVQIGLLIVGGAMVFAMLLTVVVGRLLPQSASVVRVETDIYAVSAGALMLLIAFTFSIAFNDYNEASTAADEEASQVLAMARAADFMEPTLRAHLQDDLMCYAKLVSTYEWDRMSQGDFTLDGPVQDTIMDMQSSISEPEGIKAAGVGLDYWIQANNARGAARGTRMLAGEWLIPPLVWIMLIIGVVLMIGSLLLFVDRQNKVWVHAVVIAGPVFLAVSGLVLIYFFEMPFAQTPGGIRPDAMNLAVEAMSAGRQSPEGLSKYPPCPTDTLDHRVFDPSATSISTS